MPTIAIIINRTAGSGAAIEAESIANSLRAGGFEPSIVHARDGSEIAAAAKRARAERQAFERSAGSWSMQGVD